MPKTTEYRCLDCGKRFPSSALSYAALDHAKRVGVCRPCNVIRWEEHARTAPRIYLQTDGDTGVYSHYNHGLDRHIANRGEYRKAVKEAAARGVVPTE